MINRKLENFDTDLDDLLLDVNELKDQLDGPDDKSLDEIARGWETEPGPVDDGADWEN